MAVFIALLRAVNVGGTGKLPMTDFKAICERAGCAKVRTYIASGNAVFESRRPEADVKAALEVSLEEYAGKPMRVLVRTRAEMAAVLKAKHYHYQFLFCREAGHVDGRTVKQTLPQALEWVWRGYRSVRR